MANSFDDRSVQRIARTVRTVEKSPLNSPTYRRRSRSRSSAGESVSGNPFQLSLTIIDSIQYASVTGGTIFSSGQNQVTSGLVNLSSYAIGATIYVYLKVGTDWFNGVDLMNRPDLTILEGTGTTNFYSNPVLFPKTDEDNLYYNIGQISVTDDGESNPVYTIINQVANENVIINDLELNGFKLVAFFEGKSTDIDADINYSLTVNHGTAKLPDNSNVAIPSQTNTVSVAGDSYVDIKVTFLLGANGFNFDYNASLEFTPASKVDENLIVFFSAGSINTGIITQNQIGDFVSDGRVW